MIVLSEPALLYKNTRAGADDTLRTCIAVLHTWPACYRLLFALQPSCSKLLSQSGACNTTLHLHWVQPVTKALGVVHLLQLNVTAPLLS